MLLKNNFINKYRYRLLLIFILAFLLGPAFTNPPLSDIILVLALSFLFVQSVWVFTDKKRHVVLSMVAVAILLGISWFSKTLDDDIFEVQVFQLSLYVLFFMFVTFALFTHLIKTKKVTVDSIIIAIAIYCLFGIIGGSLAMLLSVIFPFDAYNLPPLLHEVNMLDYTYYSFVTLTTLGYGDITPARQETQALGYMLAVTGQFYVAIVVAILVSKLVTHQQEVID